MTDTGILINKSNITIIMGIISIFAIVFATVTTINTYAFRIDQLEIAQKNTAEEFTNKMAVFNTEISTLSDSIVSLTISLNILQERLKFVGGSNGTTNR